MSPRLEDFFSSWGIFVEGPVRKNVRTLLGEALGVAGVQFPLLTWVRKKIKG